MSTKGQISPPGLSSGLVASAASSTPDVLNSVSLEPQPPPIRRLGARSSNSFSERRRGSILVGQRTMDLMATEHPGGKGPKFALFVIRQFKAWGYFIADHDWKALVICLLISLLGLAKVLTTKQRNDITGYSPYGARARTEYSVYQNFFALDGRGVTVYVFALAKDGGNMLRDSHLTETVEVNV